MSLAAAQELNLARLRELVAQQRGHLAELKEMHQRRPMPPSLREEQVLTNALMVLAFMGAELHAVEVTRAAAVMTGEVPQPVQAQDLELHPAHPEQRRQTAPTEELLASLHRAGDHTLDEGVGR